MANKVKWGLSNVHVAKRTESEGTVTYSTPVAIPGAVNLSLEPSGDESNFYADNMRYFSTFANNGYEGELELALVPEFFKTDYLGYKEDDAGQIVETDEPGGEFALLFQVQGNEEATRFIIYNVKASRPSQEFATQEETLEPQPSTLNLVMSGEVIENGGHAYISEADSEATTYETFFTVAPELPTFTPSL